MGYAPYPFHSDSFGEETARSGTEVYFMEELKTSAVTAIAAGCSNCKCLQQGEFSAFCKPSGPFLYSTQNSSCVAHILDLTETSELSFRESPKKKPRRIVLWLHVGIDILYAVLKAGMAIPKTDIFALQKLQALLEPIQELEKINIAK